MLFRQGERLLERQAPSISNERVESRVAEVRTAEGLVAVSYTHLTLPTSDLV